ncbi:MAG: class I SAM-dependent methyltransferase [Rubricella sp.]
MRDITLFLRQMLRNPAQIVALGPSSSRLGRRMASVLSPEDGPILEFGGGTGRLTRQILARGIRQDQLAIFELDPTFAAYLRDEFPEAHVLNTGAQNAADAPVTAPGATVSGLPILSMPEELQRAIVGAAFEKMRPGGRYIQFTYGTVPPLRRAVREELGLTWRTLGRVWWNLPPAQVYEFRKKAVDGTEA